MDWRYLVVIVMVVVVDGGGDEVFSARLVHRFSEEVKVRRRGNGGGGVGEVEAVNWPRRSSEYYRMLLNSDLEKQKMKLGPHYKFLYPSEGSSTLPLGNDFGWLHYIWIDIGTPKLSFLVALDAGSDLLWVPCDCIQCAPLSSSYYSSLVLPRIWGIYYAYMGHLLCRIKSLNEYNPSK